MTMTTGGSGLGLFISRELARAMQGGTSQWSRFWDRAAFPVTTSPARGERMTRILIVDDEPSVCALVRDILELEDYEVVEAADGPSALERVESRRPIWMVLDIMMPGNVRVGRPARTAPPERSGELPIILLDGGVGRRHHLGRLDGRHRCSCRLTRTTTARLGRPPDRLPEDARSKRRRRDILKESAVSTAGPIKRLVPTNSPAYWRATIVRSGGVRQLPTPLLNAVDRRCRSTCCTCSTRRANCPVVMA